MSDLHEFEPLDSDRILLGGDGDVYGVSDEERPAFVDPHGDGEYEELS